MQLMNLQTLDNFLTQAIYKIPEYQRGYAWEEKHVKALIEDISNYTILNQKNNSGSNHYFMGMIITYQTPKNDEYDNRSKPVVEIVDGQQRLISLSLLASAVLHRLNRETSQYTNQITDYLYHCDVPRIRLNENVDNEFYLELLKNGCEPSVSTAAPGSFTSARLKQAGEIFQKYVSKLSLDDVKAIHKTITSQLSFTTYGISEESEIGMTFELINNRGKQLINFELLKNYLLYWVNRNIQDKETRNEFAAEINSAWKQVYSNINEVELKDELIDNFLESVYVITSKKTTYKGYESFKTFIPIQPEEPAEEIKKINNLLKQLKDLSYHYKIIKAPERLYYADNNENTSAEEYEWLVTLAHTERIINFTPLILQCKNAYWNKEIAEEPYIQLLKTVERFIYKVYMIGRLRSDTAKSFFYNQAVQFDAKDIVNITNKIEKRCSYYVSQEMFAVDIQSPRNWYENYHALIYTLFEYEKYLFKLRNPHQLPRVKWEEINGNTSIEHVLPQTPTDSYWLDRWNNAEQEIWMHDIGNLFLTLDNSVYSNFPYPRKCRGENENGEIISNRFYASSDIKQEREMTNYSDWTPEEAKDRHNKIAAFILERWQS